MNLQKAYNEVFRGYVKEDLKAKLLEKKCVHIMWSLMRTQTYSTIDCYEKCIRKKKFKCNKTQKIFGSMVLTLCFKVVYSKWNDFNFFETYESTAWLCRPHHASEWHAIDFKHPSFLRKMFKQTWIHRWCHDKNVLLRFGFENDYFCDGMIFFCTSFAHKSPFT